MSQKYGNCEECDENGPLDENNKCSVCGTQNN
jgi:hypothetical protein